MLRGFVPALCALFGAATSGQGNYKLNGELTTPPAVAGDVEDARITPDGRRLVYLARQDDPDVAELYCVPLDGSTDAVKLSGALVAGGAIDDFEISPDGKRVVYQADQERVYEHGLFSVPIDGSASPIRLDVPSDNHAFFRYEISPDGRQVVSFDTLDFRLRTVPIEGGEPRALLSLRPGGYVFEARFSPDGERVLFTADPDGLSGLGLYSVRVDGRASASRHVHRPRPVRLSAPLAPGSEIFSFRLGPGGRAVYQIIGGTFDLYGVPIDGSARAVRLNPIPVPGGHVTYTGYALSPDGRWVVYRADQEQDDVYELYRVPADGSATAARLNGPMSPGGDVDPGFEIAPDSRSVVYLADQDTDGVTELHAVPIDGSASSLRLSSTLPALESLRTFRISPDAARVVYVTARDCGASGLFSVPLGGGSGPVQLDGPFPCDGEVAAENELEFQISPDGRRVVYVTDGEADGVLARELYSVPIEGEASPIPRARSVHRVLPVRLNAALPPGGSVGDPGSGGFAFAIGPGGVDVVYRAGQETASVLELFLVPVDGRAAPRKLNPPLALGPPPGDVVDAKLDHDGRRVVFRADARIDEAFELFSAPLSGLGQPVKLDGALPAGSSALDFEIAAGIDRVVYRARQGASVRLFSAPVDGSAGATELGGPLVAGGDVRSFHVSPDGLRVAYVADQDTDEVDELYCVPTDGSASAVKLNAPLPPGGSVDCSAEVRTHAHFSSDGERLVYLADQEEDQVFELYSVSTEGVASPVRLNAPPVPGGDVVTFATCFLIGAGSRVVYLADQDTNNVFELYSAPLDGSASPIKLNGPLAPGGDVSLGVDGVHLSPAGDRVVYRADQETDEAYELFSVPIDGSAPPVRLNGAMIAAGDVSPLAPSISPDGARVLYLADQERDGCFDLHSAPIDGSAPAVRLSSLPFHSRHVEELEVDPEGRFAVYRADQDTDQVFELYRVPIDGSSPAVRLLAPSSTVESFRIAAGGDEVVFAAALGATGVNLWMVSTEGPGRPALLSGPVAGEGVRTDPAGIWISPSGRIALYLADQDRAGVMELYGASLSRPHARRF